MILSTFEKKPMKKYFNFLKRIAASIKLHFSEDFKFDNKLNIKQFIIVFLFFTPMYSLSYYDNFLGQFGINYFLYLSPEDLVFSAYKNTFDIYFALILILFASLGFSKLIIEKKSIKKGVIFIIIFIASYLEAYFFYNCLGKTFFIFSIFFFFMLFINFTSILRQNILIYSYVIIATFYFTSKGKHDYNLVKEKRISFDLILNNNDYLMVENDKCKYWVGKLSKAIFIYDRNLGKIRVIPYSRIQEISYTLNEY